MEELLLFGWKEFYSVLSMEIGDNFFSNFPLANSVASKVQHY